MALFLTDRSTGRITVFFFFHLRDGGHITVCSVLSTSCLHPSRSSGFLSHSWLFTSSVSIYLSTLSLRLNVGLPILLLPPSFPCSSGQFLTHSGYHNSLLPATFIHRCLFISISSPNYPHLPSVFSFHVTHILRIQLFSATATATANSHCHSHYHIQQPLPQPLPQPTATATATTTTNSHCHSHYHSQQPLPQPLPQPTATATATTTTNSHCHSHYRHFNKV